MTAGKCSVETISSHISAIIPQIATWRTLTFYLRLELQCGRVKSMQEHLSGWKVWIRPSLYCLKTMCLFLSPLLLLLYWVKGIHSYPSHVLILGFESHFLPSVGAVLVRLIFCSTLLLGLPFVSLAGLSGQARQIHFHLFLIIWISIFSSCFPPETFLLLMGLNPGRFCHSSSFFSKHQDGLHNDREVLTFQVWRRINKYPSGLTNLSLISYSVPPSIANTLSQSAMASRDGVVV